MRVVQFANKGGPSVEPVVEIRNATVWRGETRALDGLDLDVAAGGHVAILGPNGSGKSTLLRLLSGHAFPEHREGSSIRLFGRPRWDVWELRSHLGIVSHDLQVTCSGEAIGFDVVLSGFHSTPRVWPHHRFTAEQADRTRRVIDELGLGGLEQRRYASLSTGEQRRLLLARALVHDPRVLVLDEPTSGLDLQASFAYVRAVRSLMRTGRTVILVTHHLHEIPPEVRRVVLLKEGRVVGDGPVGDLLTSERMSDLFETGLEIVRRNGHAYAVPLDPPGSG